MSRKRPGSAPPGGVRVLQVDRREEGVRLDLFLVTALPELSRKQAKRLVDGKRVAVNGRIDAMASRLLRCGDRVEVQVQVQVAHPEAPRASLPVVYEDAHCLAVNKPPGLPSGPTQDPKRLHAAQLAGAQSGRQLVLLHRLDKDTSGVLLLAKSREFTTALGHAFKHRLVEKLYLALACGRRPQAGTVTSHLREGEAGRMHTVRSGGMKAVTELRTLAGSGEYWAVEAHPQTGRTHQIRVHLAQAGCPILGDALYGGAARVGPHLVPRQMLHACRLAFDHPATGQRLEIVAPLPEDFCSVARAALGERLPAALRPFLAP
ncbi:MAG TPA: RluA family pseudouridine synthase [Deferrisomatales bacterium]|nr:RluA family pseudouridine synthase [Deferrisomatales bacterium]